MPTTELMLKLIRENGMQPAILISGHRLVSIFSIIAGLGIAFISHTIGWGELKEPAPGMYPGIVGYLMALFAFASMFGKAESAKSKNENANGGQRVIVIISALIFWCIANDYLGHLLVTFITSTIITRTVNDGKWKFALTISAVITAIVYILFDYYFYIGLPNGLWEG